MQEPKDYVPKMEGSENELVTRSGWQVRTNHALPGDKIQWCQALNNEPVYHEQYGRSESRVETYRDDEPNLGVVPRYDGSRCYPCTFCSTRQVCNREGHITADYDLLSPAGNVIAHTCHSCIAGAETINYDPFDSETMRRFWKHYVESAIEHSGVFDETYNVRYRQGDVLVKTSGSLRDCQRDLRLVGIDNTALSLGESKGVIVDPIPEFRDVSLFR